MEETKYLYYQLDFYKDGIYQFECVAEDLDEVREHLQWWETEFDDEEAKAEIRIRGIGLLKETFESLKKEQPEF